MVTTEISFSARYLALRSQAITPLFTAGAVLLCVRVHGS